MKRYVNIIIFSFFWVGVVLLFGRSVSPYYWLRQIFLICKSTGLPTAWGMLIIVGLYVKLVHFQLQNCKDEKYFPFARSVRSGAAFFGPAPHAYWQRWFSPLWRRLLLPPQIYENVQFFIFNNLLNIVHILLLIL